MYYTGRYTIYDHFIISEIIIICHIIIRIHIILMIMLEPPATSSHHGYQNWIAQALIAILMDYRRCRQW